MESRTEQRTANTFDRYLLEYEIKSRMSMDEFCEKMGFVRSTYQRLVNSPENWTRGYIEKAAQILSLSGDQILRIFFASSVA